MMKADLHVHTTYSDGTCTPAEVVNMACDRGVAVLAITDHDTLAGADALQGAALPIRVIPSVELRILSNEIKKFPPFPPQGVRSQS